MRHIALTFIVMVMMLGSTMYGRSATDPQQTKVAMDSMTVAQLDEAGDEARALKDYERAISCFERAISKDRKNAALYNKLGLVELKKGDSRAARNAFRKAVKYNPKFAEAINNLGAVDYTQRRFGAAAKQFQKALALDETRASFHVNLGAAWFGQKKLERAMAEYARALQLDPEVLNKLVQAGVTAQIASPEERARYSYMLAKIYAKRGDAEQCLHCLKMAKEQGYRDLANVYKDEEFAGLLNDKRLAEIVPAPGVK